MLPMQRKSLCMPGKVVDLTMSDIAHWNSNESAASAVRCDNGHANAGLDIIASYARNCGKQLRLSATGAVLSKDDSVSCAIRENIRESGGAFTNAVAGPNGAKEIDCYV